MENREKYLSATRILSRLSIEKMIFSLYSLLENLEVSKKLSIFAVMKKEFGKWLLDIAKYMVTGLLLSTIFADMQEPIIVYMVALLSLVLLITGLGVIYHSEQEESIKRKKGNKK